MALASQASTGRVLSYLDIENEMLRLMAEQEEMTQRLAALAEQAAQAEADYKIAFHTARYHARVGGSSSGKVTADMAEDMAVMETQELRISAETKRAKHDALRQAIMTARSNQESLRSLMASYRESGG